MINLTFNFGHLSHTYRLSSNNSFEITTDLVRMSFFFRQKSSPTVTLISRFHLDSHISSNYRVVLVTVSGAAFRFHPSPFNTNTETNDDRSFILYRNIY